MKKISIITLSTLLVLIGSLFTLDSVFSKATEADSISPPPLILTVKVTQVPDICGVESPCVCYVTIRQGGNLLGSTAYDSGPGTYYVPVDSGTSGYVIADVVQVPNIPGCTCGISTTSDTQTGPPYPDFAVYVY